MYLLLSVINCIFNIVVIVWLSASSPSLKKTVNLAKSLFSYETQSGVFLIMRRNSLIPSLVPCPFWQYSDVHLCAFAVTSQSDCRVKIPANHSSLFPHTLANGDAACEGSSSHRSPQCCSQPATSQLTCLLIEKYGWNDDTNKQVGELIRHRHLCYQCRWYIYFFNLRVLYYSPAHSQPGSAYKPIINQHSRLASQSSCSASCSHRVSAIT